MSAADELRERLARVVAEAREAGLGAELAGWWRELARPAPTPDEAPSSDVPGRYGMIGASPAMEEVFDLLDRITPSDVSVLVHGETGTGKELVAKALHEHGPRAGRLFLAENCAAVPANLLESELFGHTKGSFTGAVVDREGHFVAADGGTVFLDEIGDMPLEMQAKLLRVLQEGEVRPVGANKTRKVDVRVIAATNKDLVAMCAERTFRQDLYFRLNVITVHLPPLRERVGDVPLLVHAFLDRAAPAGSAPLSVEPDAMAALEAWSWPGNVRELENEVQRAAVFAAGTVRKADLSPKVNGLPGGPGAP